MRTTLDIDADVLRAVKERAQYERRTAGQVLSDLARTALNPPVADGRDQEQEFHGFVPIPHRGTPVTDADVEAIREAEGL